MGLKQDVKNAMGSTSASPSTALTKTNKPAQVKPVEVSSEALFALSQKAREWSGWPDLRMVVGKPPRSPFASVDNLSHTMTVNADALVLNPHRVLLTVTPFRLRQEAVLTGCMLHEAGHARHSNWITRSAEEAAVKPLLHSDGAEPTAAVVGLARLMEEPRVEGLQARDADRIGAAGLGWTMRAASAHLLPTTTLHLTDANQRVMDLITSWALRAGRQIAMMKWTGLPLRNWVQDFTTLLHTTLVQHLAGAGALDAYSDAQKIITLLQGMAVCEDDRGPSMIDMAREVLDLLFPETPTDEMPEPQGGCESGDETGDSDDPSDDSESGDDAEGDEQGKDGEGNTEPEDEGAGEDPGEGSEGDPGDDAEQGSEDGDESGEAEDQSEEQGSEDGSDEAESEEGDEAGDSATGSTEADSDPLAEALAALEASAQSETEAEAEEEADKAPPTETGNAAGAGGEGALGEGYRAPTKDEREIQKGAERFLRDLINPSESSKVHLSESPSATVDPAALAAWKADGGTRDPRFFVRTRREIQPSPPVQIAILVDVSGSMDELQKPSAILSWALAAAALDLRNFAGRGQQMQSTLIHWGSTARVIQRPGEMIPGIKEDPCLEGTMAMHTALDLVAEQMPGFFDITERPVHRLLVQFTDWQLSNQRAAGQRVEKAMAAGVNMISVVPRNYSYRYTSLAAIMEGCKVQRGTSTLLKYNRAAPGAVWDEAAKALT